MINIEQIWNITGVVITAFGGACVIVIGSNK